MSLRIRLIVAFFLLSVVPLGAVTMLSYRNNVAAVRTAAGREADLLAGELTQRMQLVTAQLSERVEHLTELPAVADADSTTSQRAATTPAVPSPSTPASAPAAAANVASAAIQLAGSALLESGEGALNTHVAQVLGEAAVLLNSVELQGLRGGRPRPNGRGNPSIGRAPSVGGQRPPPPPPPVPGVAVPPAVAGTPPPDGARRGRPEPRDGRGSAPRPAGRTDAIVTIKPADPASAGDERERILIDLAPVRRELYREILSDSKVETLTLEERQRIAREVNQRMLGIVQGLQLGAKSLQEKAANAERQAAEAAAKSESAAPSAPVAPAEPRAATSPVRSGGTSPPRPATTSASSGRVTKSALTGNRLGVTVERDGQVVQQVNAEINLPNVLATVFTTTPRERGEIPFAIASDGQVHTRSEADRATIQALGPDTLSPSGPPTRTSIRNEWIVVTTADPSGSGLRFGIARPIGDSMADLRRTAARNASFGMLFIVVALVGIVPISGRLTRNLTSLTDAVSRIAHGDFRARVPVKSRDEIGKLASAFNRMAEDVERHQRAAVEQERIRRELELGRQIQNEMLPHAPLRLGLTEIKGVSIPAREVGGDFFNYFEVEGGRVALLVGDVSGKGVGAALLMANIQASLRTRLALGQDLSAIADAIDRDIEANSPGPVYSTLFVAILDPSTRRLRYVNAGHHPQYVLRRGRPLERMESTGLPVGLLAGRGYREREVQLESGDLLFFYTDGFVEAENATGDMFGAERLEALVTQITAGTTDEVLEQVESAVNLFRGAVEPGDDGTMMAVKIG